jgi:hypothetical protein
MVRWRTLDTLGEIGPAARTALPSVRAGLKDDEPEVRQGAALALDGSKVETSDLRLVSVDAHAKKSTEPRKGERKTCAPVGAPSTSPERRCLIGNVPPASRYCLPLVLIRQLSRHNRLLLLRADENSIFFGGAIAEFWELVS